MKKIAWPILFLIFTASVVASAQGEEGLSVGETAPNLIGRLTTGGFFRLNSVDAKLKVINFWWIKCKPCKKELPEIAELEKKFPAVKFFAVHTVELPRETIVEFINSLPKGPSNVVMGNSKMLELFRFQSLPHTVVLDGKNRVMLVITGYTENNMKKLEKFILDST